MEWRIKRNEKNLPKNQNAPDLIEIYKEYKKRKSKDFEI